MIVRFLTILVILTFSALPACAAKGPAEQAATGIVETVLDGCEKEIESYCKEVTPGDARMLACMYAHGDKLSSECEYALYDAAIQLERAVSALSYVTMECKDDLIEHCENVEVGEGRVLDCLNKNEKDLDPRCVRALDDVGLK